jgi:hypothetical protein
MARAWSQTRLLSGGDDNTLKLWNAATGELLRIFEGHSVSVKSVAFSHDGRRIVSGSDDTTVRLWDTATGNLLTTLIGGRNEEWLAMTPAGFFDASDGGLDMLSVVRGFKVFSVDQLRDQLQRKDLLQDLLSGDMLRRHEDAASKLNLEKILDSGPTLDLLENEIERAGDTIRIKVRIFNNEGGGIGKKLIWRVNSQTQGETEPEILRNLQSANGLRLFPNDAQAAPFEAMMSKGIVLKLNELPTDEIKAALAEFIIVQLHGYALRGEQPRRLTRLLVFDEAHRIANNPRLEALGREGRAFGVGIVLGTQYPGDIPEATAGALATKLFLLNNQAEHRRHVVRQVLGTTTGNESQQLLQKLSELEPGQGLFANPHHNRALVTVLPHWKRQTPEA